MKETPGPSKTLSRRKLLATMSLAGAAAGAAALITLETVYGGQAGTWIGKTKCTPVDIWDYAGKIVNKPEPSDPKTWDWTPALKAAAATGRARSRTRKTSQSPMKAKRHDSAKTDFSCDRNMFPKSNDFDLGI